MFFESRVVDETVPDRDVVCRHMQNQGIPQSCDAYELTDGAVYCMYLQYFIDVTLIYICSYMVLVMR